MQEEIKKLISEAKNICVIPSPSNEPESLTVALALFYILKDAGKNVNLIMDHLPETLAFLTPSLDFITQPKNFVISIPKNIAEVSQVYYEKNEENLKIHLTIEKGAIKKDNISFYFSDAKPDLTITLGIMDFKKELENKLDSFGFLLDSPIINIDNHSANTRFGKINIVEEETSLSEILFEITRSLSQHPISSPEVGSPLAKKHSATSLLTGLTLYYDNFQSQKTTPEVFELCAILMKEGANRQEILSNIYKTEILGPGLKKSEEVIITS